MRALVMKASEGYDFDCIIYVPDKVRPNSKILVSMNDGATIESIEPDERIAEYLEKGEMPVLVPIINKFTDKTGRVVAPPQKTDDMDKNTFEKLYEQYKKEIAKYTQFDPEGLLMAEGSPLYEQIQNAVKSTYSILFSEGVLPRNNDMRFDVEGYSAQGVKAQRLAMLIPESVRSVYVGGAISSIPIAKTEQDGVELPYPAGFSDIDKYVGQERAQTILEDYKKVSQNVYVSENELLEDGRFILNGAPTSQHDISPEVVPVVAKQVELYGEDINDRVEGVINLNRQEGANIQNYLIYADTIHHSKNPATIDNACEIIKGLDTGTAVVIESPADRINISHQEDRCKAAGRTMAKGPQSRVEIIETTREKKKSGLEDCMESANLTSTKAQEATRTIQEAQNQEEKVQETEEVK